MWAASPCPLQRSMRLTEMRVSSPRSRRVRGLESRDNLSGWRSDLTRSPTPLLSAAVILRPASRRYVYHCENFAPRPVRSVHFDEDRRPRTTKMVSRFFRTAYATVKASALVLFSTHDVGRSTAFQAQRGPSDIDFSRQQT